MYGTPLRKGAQYSDALHRVNTGDSAPLVARGLTTREPRGIPLLGGNRYSCQPALANLEDVCTARREPRVAVLDSLAVDLHGALLHLSECLAGARHQSRSLQHLRDREPGSGGCEPDFRKILRQRPLAEARDECLTRAGTATGAVESVHDLDGKFELDVARIAPTVSFGAKPSASP